MPILGKMLVLRGASSDGGVFFPVENLKLHRNSSER